MNNKQPEFTFAHTGLNVKDKDTTAAWYEKHLNMKVVRSVPGAMHFLADPTGRVILEIYSNDAAPVLDFQETHFLTLHLAVLTDNPKETEAKLLHAGAVTVDPYKVTSAGDELIMMRDPFGLGLQLIKRKEPMF
jgi:catechol-2,3-dioxygenase